MTTATKTTATINKPVGVALEILTRVRATSSNGSRQPDGTYSRIERSYVEGKKRTDCLAAAITETTRLNSLPSVIASRYVMPYLVVTKPVVLQGEHVKSTLA